MKTINFNKTKLIIILKTVKRTHNNKLMNIKIK